MHLDLCLYVGADDDEDEGNDDDEDESHLFLCCCGEGSNVKVGLQLNCIYVVLGAHRGGNLIL